MKSISMWRSITLLILFAGTTFAWSATNEIGLADYAPYLDGHPWPRIPVVAYVETASNIWIHPSAPKSFPTVREVFDTNADFTMVLIQCPNGDTFKTYNKFVMGPCLCAVYSGDFNGDGKPDFLAIKPSAGNGLAGDYCTGVFAFSRQTDYQFTRIETMGLGPHDLVTDPATKTFRLVHRSFRRGICVDGRDHSFWVNRFYYWDDDSFREDTTLPPIWIQYLDRPSHDAAKLLTPDLKRKIWAKDLESEATIEW